MRYMVCTNESGPSGAETTEWADDLAAEAERELQWPDAVQIQDNQILHAPATCTATAKAMFPNQGEGCFSPISATNFEFLNRTRSSLKNMPRRSPRLMEGPLRKHVSSAPRWMSPEPKKCATRTTIKKLFSPPPQPAKATTPPPGFENPEINDEGLDNDEDNDNDDDDDDDDDDKVWLPRTFPIQGYGSPTPRTTYLDEPPETMLPPPPYIPPYSNRVSQYPTPTARSVQAFSNIKLSLDSAT